MTDNSSSNNDQKIKFSIFNDQYDMTPQASEVHWWELVELFAEHKVFDGDKTQMAHFNGCKFHEGGDRRQNNVEAMHMLVLDYDDGLAIDQAQQLFSEYEHIGYTSYNHQVSKKGKPPVDKYRVIFPLVTPCPMKDWMEIRHNVETFAPEVDMASVRLHQPFAVPLVRTNGEKLTWHNKGKRLDVSDWERQQVTDHSGQFTANPINRSEHRLEADDIVKTKSGTIRVGDVTKNVTGVYCPFHEDNSPGEFISKSDSGNIYLHCKKCGTIYMDDEHEETDKQDFDIANWIANHTTVKSKPKKKGTSKVQLWEDLLCIEEQVVEPYNREKRGELIRKHCLSPRKRMLLYAFEGFGKSYLTILWAQKGQKVVFGCNSNVQAREQAESFTEAGCKVQAILSREHRLETEYQVAVERHLPSHPWDHGKVNESKTIANMMKNGMTEEEAGQLWDDLETVGPDFENHDIVVTTHARIQSWGKVLHLYKQSMAWSGLAPEDRPDCKYQIPENAIIVYDDPSKADFMRLKDFENRFADAVIDKKKIRRTKIDNHEYFVKPNTLVKGFGFVTQYLVFTTTEVITSHLIQSNYENVYEPKLMPDQKMLAGNIHMLKTELVRKKMDGILPPIVERIKKEGYDVEYIADGQGNKYNLVNTKGQNVFVGKDTIIEISQPHEQDVIQTQHELGWGKDDRFTVRLAITLDQVHQAIGRNSGYRYSDLNVWDGPTCIVLCEPQIFKSLLSTMRYSVTSSMDVDMYQLDFRKRERNNLLNSVIWFLQNYSTYICNGLGGNNKEFQKDAQDCLSVCSSKNKTVRQKRMLDSLTYLHGNMSELYKPKLERIIDTIAEF